MKTRICVVICTICLLLCSIFALTSCNSDDPVGIISAEINEDGELVLTYSDGNEQNLGVVVGKDGSDGKDGEDGSNGKDGADGTNGQNGINGVDGADGSLVITSDGSSIPAASAKVKELTPALVNRLIQRIEVHKSEKVDGRKRVKLDIYFTVVGLIDIPDENEIREMIEEIQKSA